MSENSLKFHHISENSIFQIKQCWSCEPSTIYSFLRKNSSIKNELSLELEESPYFETEANIFLFIYKNLSLQHCKVCGKILRFEIAYGRKRTYCNRKCGIIAGYEKRKKICLEKYGTETPLQSSIVREKCKQTLNKKYGCNDPFSSHEIQEKIKNTNLKKYGVEKPSQNKLIQEKIRQKTRQTNFNKILRWKKYIVPLFTIENYKGYNTIEKHIYKWKCVKCGNEFEQEIRKTGHIKEDRFIPRCLNCYPYLSGTSNTEKELVDFLKPYFSDLIENDRLLIKPFELDIVIPNKKIAIEFDGLIWHSDKFQEDSNYHLKKTELVEKQGYRLIQIFEDEWVTKQDIVKSRLKAILNIDQERVFARKCEIKEINSKDKNDFLNKYHLQDGDKSKIKIGLFLQEELISVMTFGKPRFNKNYEYELIRFASSKQVIGGASKLLSYFEKNFKPKSIITYADRRYSQGNLYRKLGFTFLRNSDLNYFWTQGHIKLSRYECQKHKLKNILGDKFDINLSESENMMLNGYFKIFDCGNMVFLKEYLCQIR